MHKVRPGANALGHQNHNGDGLEDLKSERAELQMQVVDLMAELQLCQSLADQLLASEESIETIEQCIKDLEKELLLARLQNLQDKKILECLHHQKFVMDQLFLSNSDTSAGKISQEQTQLVSEVLGQLQEVEGLKGQQLKARQARVSAQLECRELKGRLDLLKRRRRCDGPLGDLDLGAEDTRLNRLKRALKRSQDEVTLRRHILLALITGSGVNWSKDKELSELVLSLGQHCN